MIFFQKCLVFMSGSLLCTASFAGNSASTVSVASVGMANPASVNCIKQGGSLVMRQNAAGTYGICLFKGGRECEEWALFRGECPVGGLPVKRKAGKS